MKFVVTVGAMFIDGVRRTRGEIVEMSEADAVKHGVRLQKIIEAPVVEVVEPPKPKRTRKVKSEANEDR